MIQINEQRSPRATVAALCCAALFLYALYLGALGVLLPAVGVSFNLGAAAQGRLFPADFGGFVVGVLVCGALSDRLGRKAVLLGGVAAYALGLALFSRAGMFPPALLATGLVGYVRRPRRRPARRGFGGPPQMGRRGHESAAIKADASGSHLSSF